MESNNLPSHSNAFYKMTREEVIDIYGDYLTKEQKEKIMEKKYTLDKPENTVFCSTNTPEVQEFIDLSSIPVETDGIDEQKVTKSKWQSLTSSEDGPTSV